MGGGITGIVEISLVPTDDMAQVLLIASGVHFSIRFEKPAVLFMKKQ